MITKNVSMYHLVNVGLHLLMVNDSAHWHTPKGAAGHA